MAITSANQLELLQTAEAVAREKMIDPVLVIEAMEESLARAAKSRYGAEMDIRVSIDRKTGKATFTRVRTVVEEEELHQGDVVEGVARPTDGPRRCFPELAFGGGSVLEQARIGSKLFLHLVAVKRDRVKETGRTVGQVAGREV